MAVLAAIISAGLSAGLAYATRPEFADPAQSTRATVLASLRALPGQRAVEQAARLGTRVDYPTGKSQRTYENRSMSLQDALAGGHISQTEYNRLVNPASSAYRGNLQTGDPVDPATTMIDVRVPTGVRQQTREADFTGYGDADIQGRLARAMAENGLELQEKYGLQFVEEALRQQALADPEGTEARALLADKINEMEAARKERQRPVASRLDAQIADELARGRDVDPEADEIARAVLARRGGTTLAGGDITGELESGPLGDERLRQRIQKGTGYLSSGVSPEDAAYREEQQSLANMASFLAGRTPQSQFSNLSGGQQGAAPQFRGPSLPGVDPNLQQNATQAGLGNYSQNIRNVSTQVSPWFAGLSGVVNLASAYAGQPQQRT